METSYNNIVQSNTINTTATKMNTELNNFSDSLKKLNTRNLRHVGFTSIIIIIIIS